MWERKDPLEDWKRESVTVSRRRPERWYCGGEEQKEGGKVHAPGPGATGAHAWKTGKTSKSCCPNTKFSEFHQSALSLPLKRKPPTAGRVSLHPALTGWSRPALSFIFTPLVILPSDYCLVNDNRFIFNPWVAQWCSGYHGSLVWGSVPASKAFFLMCNLHILYVSMSGTQISSHRPKARTLGWPEM